MRIPFTDIPEQGSRYEISGKSWFPDEFRSGAGSVAAEFDLFRKQAGKVELQGKLLTSVILRCDRCLRKFRHTVRAQFGCLLELPESGHHWRVQEIECDWHELDIIHLDAPVVDLGDLLHQQLLLSLPEKKLCTDSCRGLCAECGMDLNDQQCSCVTDTGRSPFAMLAAVRKTVK